MIPCTYAGAGVKEGLVVDSARPGGFPLVTPDHKPMMHVDPKDHVGVIRAAKDLGADVKRVTGMDAQLVTTAPKSKHVVLIGTLGKSKLIDRLVDAGKLTNTDLKGKWESFVITTVNKPAPGIDQALVIAGSDKRGTIYGIYELSEQLGVSPWTW